ncbi:hypothetical protein AB0368_21905 [Actinoplanes sp. NPDC051475]|uniref:hypothetical protein n=1 Tax=Actinoplanes sp. NPDC051475 TaxID=3157225 RepID=UPI003450E99E
MNQKPDKLTVAAAFLTAVAVVLGTGAPVAASAVSRDATVWAFAAYPAADTPPTHKQLRRGLLNLSDMPPGFALTDRGDDAMGDLFMTYAPCDMRPGEPDYEPLPTSVFVRLAKGDAGPDLVEAIGATGTKLSREMIRSLDKVVDHCPVSVSPGATTTIRRLPFPRFGDASIAIRVIARHRDGYRVSTEHSMVGIVASRDVCIVFQLSKADELSVQDIKTIMRRGTRKLRRIG